MEIKRYEDADFHGLDALWNEAFPSDSPWNQANIAVPAKMAFQPDLLFVSTQGEEIIGSVMAGYDGHRGWLYSVAVRKARRKRNVGTALVRHAEQALIALGCGKINLQVRTSNENVVRFYERLGYAVEDRVSLGRRVKAVLPPKIARLAKWLADCRKKSGHGLTVKLYAPSMRCVSTETSCQATR